MKSVRRRSVEENASVAPRLSENISLFQSLRVLQEGEEDEESTKAGMFTKNSTEIFIIGI